MEISGLKSQSILAEEMTSKSKTGSTQFSPRNYLTIGSRTLSQCRSHRKETKFPRRILGCNKKLLIPKICLRIQFKLRSVCKNRSESTYKISLICCMTPFLKLNPRTTSSTRTLEKHHRTKTKQCL